jgi:hypothetical protein
MGRKNTKAQKPKDKPSKEESRRKFLSLLA